MLLPSALSCPRPARRPQLQASLFTSPPASPPSQIVSTHLFQACSSLQSLLQSPQPQLQPSPFFHDQVQASQQPPHRGQQQRQRQLPTPPMRNAVLPSPMKLRLRSHSNKSASSPIDGSSSQASQIPRKRVVKRSPPPKGVNKRRRDDEDEDMEKENNDEIETEMNDSQDQGPSTPKRIRVAPETMPLGLDRRDFEALYDNHQYTSTPLGFSLLAPRNLESEIFADPSSQGIDWTNEEDRQLVELVLQKMNLKKSDWQDCARSLGRDSGNIKQRWQSLLGQGEVGLKGRTRERSSTSATWR